MSDRISNDEIRKNETNVRNRITQLRSRWDGENWLGIAINRQK